MKTGEMQTSPFIQLRNLGKSYHQVVSEQAVFGNVDIDIGKGEFVVLVGKSGSGKSTLLNLLSGIDLPSSGDVILDGVSLSDLSEHERTLFRRRRIGFIFQSLNLLPTLTVEENLLLPLELNGKTSEADIAYGHDLLSELGLLDRMSSFPSRLSGGEQQRVAIARALVHKPEIILADEPTGNLDLETAQAVLELLDGLVRKAGKTMIMATHSREVIGLADRVLTIRKGQLFESGGN